MNRVPLAMNPLLIVGPEHTILVDPGIGLREMERFGEHYDTACAGSPGDLLAHAGVSTGAVDIVINTHLHWDHSGANVVRRADGRIVPAFANVTYCVQEGEWNEAVHPCELTWTSYLMRAEERLVRSGQPTLVRGEAEIVPGVRVIPSPGHTPHHQSVRIESEGETLFYAGDVIPTAAHLPLPYITAFDLEPRVTLETKRWILKRARHENWRLVFCHAFRRKVLRLTDAEDYGHTNRDIARLNLSRGRISCHMRNKCARQVCLALIALDYRHLGCHTAFSVVILAIRRCREAGQLKGMRCGKTACFPVWSAASPQWCQEEGMIRTPAVAGTFYDADPQRLRSAVERFLLEAEPVEAIGVMVPHAGHVYSGGVAGTVYSRIAVPESYLVLSPNHTGLGTPVSIMGSGGWETPLGTVTIDEELAAAVKQGSTLITEDAAAHRREHSIEVQLPFMQLLGNVPFVPITVMGIDYGTCEKLAAAVAEAVRASGKRILLVASSDMTHFESSTAAAAKDRLALDRMEALDPKGLYDVVVKHNISMCGFIPATIMLIAAKLLGASRAAVIDYRNSGDVSGDYNQVVGYAGVIVE